MKKNKLALFFNQISVFEYQILIMVLLSFGISHFFGLQTRTQVLILVIYFPLGLFFEYTSRKAWNYNKAFLSSPVKFSSFSWLNPLGWVGVVLLATAFSNGTLLNYVLWGGLVGNLLEQFFLALGVWTYNEDHWIVTLFTGKTTFLYKIPMAVRSGYFIFGALYWVIDRYILQSITA
ncbi:MAG: hypothetical protein KAH21_07780 [Spirochaetaceae bacterium]|nr:hypothetical protein [Spirochaetaceae bacterium]